MELTEFATYRNVLGGLMKSPLLFTQYTDIKTEDFGGHKVSKIIFATINNMFQNGISTMTPIEVDMEIERYEAAATIYRAEKGLDYLNDCYEYSTLDNFDYYYKRLKKLSLIRTLKKNHYDVSYFFKEDCDTLQEENELIERFDKATMEDILQHIERNYNEIRSAYLTDAKVNAVAADGVRALIDNFKVHPEIGFDMEGSLFSYACRGARLGKFYLRSAQSGTGKTRLAVFDACKIAYPEHYDAESKCFVTEFTSDGELRQPQKTLFITTEMDKTEIQTIMISYLSGVNEKHILTAQYEEDEEERILYAERIMEKYQDYFYLEEISDPNLTNVEALIKRYVSIEEVKVIFFDYIFTSPSLLAQFSGAKIREDSALGLMANQLKQIAKDYNVFIMSSTQVNGEGMANEGFKDERCLRGAKSLADKCDFACIVSRVTDKDLQSVSPMLKQAGLAATANSTLMEIPTHVIDIYKNRRGGLRGVRVWTRLNLGTGERKDLCITRDNNTPYPIEEFSEGILRSYKMVPYTKWKEALNGE